MPQTVTTRQKPRSVNLTCPPDIRRSSITPLAENTIKSSTGRREPRRYSPIMALLLILILPLITSCASTSAPWYKTGATRNAFDLDSRECEIIAEQYGLLQGETGKRVAPVNFSRNYRQCLESKGWSQEETPILAEDKQTQAPQPELPIALVERTLSGFEQQITMPADFTLVDSRQTAIGPMITRQFSWQDEGNTLIQVIFQENDQTPFAITPYPIADVYGLYTEGIGRKAKELLQWSTFFGKTKSEWVMGVGAYYLVSTNRRLIIVITKSLDPPASIPPDNLILSDNQHEQIDAFANHWVAWTEAQFPRPAGRWNWLKVAPQRPE